MSGLVVDSFFVGVSQDIVGSIYLFEYFGGFGMRALIGVKLHCQLLSSLFCTLPLGLLVRLVLAPPGFRRDYSISGSFVFRRCARGGSFIN